MERKKETIPNLLERKNLYSSLVHRAGVREGRAADPFLRREEGKREFIRMLLRENNVPTIAKEERDCSRGDREKRPRAQSCREERKKKGNH